MHQLQRFILTMWYVNQSQVIPGTLYHVRFILTMWYVNAAKSA